MHIACPACARSYALDPARIGPEGRKVRCAGCRESWFVPPSTPSGVGTALPETGQIDLPIIDASPAGPPPLPDFAVQTLEAADVEFVEPPTDPAPDPAPIVIEPDRQEVPRTRQPARHRRKTTGGRKPVKVGPPSRSTGRRRLAAAALLLLAVGLPASVLFRSSIVRALPGTGTLFATIGLPVNVLGLRLSEVASNLVKDSGAPILVVTGKIANPTATPVNVPPLDLTIEGEHGEVLYSWSTPEPNQDLAPGAETTFRAPLASPPPSGRRVLVKFRDGATSRRVASHR